MKKTVLLVPEITATSGYGHLSRAAALSDRLSPFYDVTIIIPSNWESTASELLGPSYKFQKADTFSSPSQKGAILDDWSHAHIVVLDGYHFSSECKRTLRELTNVVLVNDLEFEANDVDILINPGLPSVPLGVPNNVLVGPEYALIRSTFFSRVPHQRTIDQIDTAVVCFGGSDEQNSTAKALGAIAATKRFKNIRVIVGNQYSHRESLMERIKELEGEVAIEFLGQITDSKLLEVFESANFAVLPASTVAYEGCCVGLPMVVGYALENQKAIYRALQLKGAALGVENLLKVTEGHLAGNIEDAFRPERINSILEAQRNIFGKQPGQKLCQAFLNLRDKK